MSNCKDSELIECADCGLLFDPSDLANVFAHEHGNQATLEAGKYLGKKVDHETN